MRNMHTARFFIKGVVLFMKIAFEPDKKNIEAIKRNRPKPAICIYHSAEDMLRIAELIADWKLGYKFYVRHHAQLASETVLYAII